ncbi:MAG: hypothetical protein KF723_20235 [Rhizobiaceae bacterium]|nr:hypothetical protein [Rhizobiaceae bacterium]
MDGIFPGTRRITVEARSNAGMSLAMLEMGISQLPNDPLIPETRNERLALHEARLKETKIRNLE